MKLRNVCYCTYKNKPTSNITTLNNIIWYKPNKSIKVLTNIPHINDNTNVTQKDIHKYFAQNIIDADEYEYQITKLYINYGIVKKDILKKVREEMKRNVIKY